MESVSVFPTGLQTDGVRYEGLTEADWRTLLQYLQRCAWSLFNRPGHEVPLGEFEDAGMEALCYALEHAEVPHDTPWLAQTQHSNHEPPTAWNTLLSKELCHGDLLGHCELLIGAR